MERRIEFKVTGKERGKLAKAIGEFLGAEVRYLKVPTCNYDIGGSILDRNGVFIPAGGMSDSQVELLAEQFLEGGCSDQKSDKPGDALSISVPRETLSDSALYNLRKLIAGKETLFKHAFQTEKVDIMFDEEKKRSASRGSGLLRSRMRSQPIRNLSPNCANWQESRNGYS